jgi:hypothetical protein
VYGQTYSPTPYNEYHFYIWESGYSIEAFRIDDDSIDAYATLGRFQISADGRVAGFSGVFLDPTETNRLFKWDRDTGTFRSIATLENQFFDFAQSTL